jgi:hypothetical protein
MKVKKLLFPGELFAICLGTSLEASQVEVRRRKAATGNRLEADSDRDEEREDRGRWNTTDLGLMGSKIPPLRPAGDACRGCCHLGESQHSL